MSENNINAYCKICGAGYHLCLTCNNTKTFTPWRALTDSREHYKTYIIIRDYTNKYIDIQEAKRLLSQRDLDGLDTFRPEIKDVINKILEYQEENNKIVNSEEEIL